MLYLVPWYNFSSSNGITEDYWVACLHKIRKKKEIPFCLPNSCQNWFKISQRLQRFLGGRHICMHMEVHICIV